MKKTRTLEELKAKLDTLFLMQFYYAEFLLASGMIWEKDGKLVGPDPFMRLFKEI